MKKLLLALGTVFVLAACGGGDEAPPEEVPADEMEEATGDYDATAARTSYEQSCISCHGGNLEGGAGPALAGTDLAYEDILSAIQNGKGTMPAQNLPDDEAENLARWIEDQ